jgi:hypothetical protein
LSYPEVIPVRVLVLPRLVGTREAARDFLQDNGFTMVEKQLRDDLSAERIVLLCRDLSTSTYSYADELVLRLLEDGHAEAIVLVKPTEEFGRDIRESASSHGVLGRIEESSGAALGV